MSEPRRSRKKKETERRDKKKEEDAFDPSVLSHYVIQGQKRAVLRSDTPMRCSSERDAHSWMRKALTIVQHLATHPCLLAIREDAMAIVHNVVSGAVWYGEKHLFTFLHPEKLAAFAVTQSLSTALTSTNHDQESSDLQRYALEVICDLPPLRIEGIGQEYEKVEEVKATADELERLVTDRETIATYRELEAYGSTIGALQRKGPSVATCVSSMLRNDRDEGTEALLLGLGSRVAKRMRFVHKELAKVAVGGSMLERQPLLRHDEEEGDDEDDDRKEGGGEL